MQILFNRKIVDEMKMIKEIESSQRDNVNYWMSTKDKKHLCLSVVRWESNENEATSTHLNEKIIDLARNWSERCDDDDDCVSRCHLFSHLQAWLAAGAWGRWRKNTQSVARLKASVSLQVSEMIDKSSSRPSESIDNAADVVVVSMH